MKTTLAHESYKLVHQRSSWLAIIALFGLMLYSATPTAYVTKRLIAQGVGAGQWVIIIMIVVTTNFVAMELRDNTMTTLLYKSPRRRTVFFAKLIVLVGYGLFLLLVGFCFALLIKLLLVNRRFAWTAVYHQHSLLQALGLNLLGVGVYLLFTITLTLLLITIIKSSATVIIIGLFIGFLGANITGIVMQAAPGIKQVVAWNPLNMINVISQLADSRVMATTGLSNGQLLFGTLAYALLFLCAGVWAFRTRQF